MRTNLLLIVFNLSLLNIAAGQNSFSEHVDFMKKEIIETYSVDLNNDEILDKITLKFPSNSEHQDFGYSDPGVFNILEINLSNGTDFILENVFDSLAFPIRKEGNNRIQSNFVYLTRHVNGSNFLLICGPSYGCCLPKLFILKILKTSIELFYEEEFEISDFAYNAKIGNYNFTGHTYLGEAWGGYKSHFEFQSFSYPKVYTIGNSLSIDQQATYKLNKPEIDLYGNFLNYSQPVLIINNETDQRFLVDWKEGIELEYQRKYDDLSRSKANEKYFRRFNKSELRLMRNEIFASHGYIFSSPDLKEYFENKKWYKPISKDVNDKLTEIEKYNIKLIQLIENAP